MAHPGARRLRQALWLPPLSLLLLQQQQLQPLPLLEGPGPVDPEPSSETREGDQLASSRTSSFKTPPPLLLNDATLQGARRGGASNKEPGDLLPMPPSP